MFKTITIVKDYDGYKIHFEFVRGGGYTEEASSLSEAVAVILWEETHV